MIRQEFNPSSERRREEDYAAYEALLAPLNQSHPQRQGMHEEEYLRALDDDLVIKTIVEIDGREVAVPQLAPVTAYEWLNTDFYRQQFPNEFASGRLLHFMSIPGIDPGEEVVRVIKELANVGGVLVFDMPSSDEEYESRVLSTLESADAVVSGEQLLGTQTYFAGEVHLERTENDPINHLEFSDAFRLLVEKGLIDTNDYIDGAVVEDTIDNSEASELYRFFSDAYEKIANHPCLQALTPEEFLDMLSQEYVHKIVYRRNGKAETLCLATTGIDKLSWINKEYYDNLFDDKTKSNQICWFPGIATDPDPEITGRNVPYVVELLARLSEVGNNAVLLVFDTPDINTGFLDKYLEQEINNQPYTSISIEPIGCQQYKAFRIN